MLEVRVIGAEGTFDLLPDQQSLVLLLVLALGDLLDALVDDLSRAGAHLLAVVPAEVNFNQLT